MRDSELKVVEHGIVGSTILEQFKRIERKDNLAEITLREKLRGGMFG